MSDLIVPSQKPDEQGKVLQITPASAGWEYVGFEVYQLKKGQVLEKETGEQEACIVLLSGKANICTQQKEWNAIGERMRIFEKIPPYSVYVPSSDRYRVEAVTDLEIAVCLAPGKGTYSARLIAPEDVGVEIR